MQDVIEAIQEDVRSMAEKSSETKVHIEKINEKLDKIIELLEAKVKK